jgi:hypothetical protein
MAEFSGLSVDISGDAGSAVAALETTKGATRSLGRAADSTADELEELGDETSNVSFQMGALTGSTTSATGALGAFGALGTATTLGSIATKAGIATTALGGLVAVGTTLGATLGGVTAAATGLAGAFGAVVGSGLIAFGKERGEQNEERLEQLNSRIEELEELEAETGSLTDAQEEQLEKLEAQADKTEELTGITGGLKDAFGELQDELTPIIVNLGQEFVPLIEDAFDAIPTLARRIVDSLGPLDKFKAALRDAGQTVMDNLPSAVDAFMDLARDALPALRNFAEYLVNNARPAFEESVDTTKELADTFIGVGQGIDDALPKLNDLGTTILQKALPALGSFFDTLGDVSGRVKSFAKRHELVEFADTATDAVGELVATVTDSEPFQSFKSTVESDLTAVSDAISQAADGRFDDAVGTLVSRATTRIEELATLIGGEGGQGGVINDAIDSVAAFFEQGGQQKLGDAADTAFTQVESAAASAKAVIVGPNGQGGIVANLFDTVGAIAENTDFGDAFEGLTDAVESVQDSVRRTLVGEDGTGGLSQTVTDAVMGAQDYLQNEGGDELRRGMEEAAESAINGLSDLNEILVGPNGKTGVLTDMVDVSNEFISDTVPELGGDIAQAIGSGIRTAFTDIVVNPLKGKDSTFWDMLADGATWAVNNLPDIFVAVGEGIIDSITEGVRGLFRGLVGNSVLKDQLWEAADWLVNNLGDVFGDVGGAILDAIVGAISGFGEMILDPINSGIQAINDVVPGNIDIPQIGPFGEVSFSTGPAGKVPGVPKEVRVPEIGPFGDASVNVPGLPLDTAELAEGGIVTDDILARIGEGQSDEAVIPLDRADQFGTTTNYNIDVTIEGGSNMSESGVARELRREMERFDV